MALNPSDLHVYPPKSTTVQGVILRAADTFTVRAGWDAYAPTDTVIYLPLGAQGLIVQYHDGVPIYPTVMPYRQGQNRVHVTAPAPHAVTVREGQPLALVVLQGTHYYQEHERPHTVHHMIQRYPTGGTLLPAPVTPAFLTQQKEES